MAETTLRIERLDGGVLVIDAGPFATAVFEAPKVVAFEQIAGTTSRNAITNYDLELLNRFMGARTLTVVGSQSSTSGLVGFSGSIRSST